MSEQITRINVRIIPNKLIALSWMTRNGWFNTTTECLYGIVSLSVNTVRQDIYIILFIDLTIRIYRNYIYYPLKYMISLSANKHTISLLWLLDWLVLFLDKNQIHSAKQVFYLNIYLLDYIYTNPIIKMNLHQIFNKRQLINCLVYFLFLYYPISI